MSTQEATFMGGVHVPPSKSLTDKVAIERCPAPDMVYIPLSQHIGAPAQAIVKTGDMVTKGQMIAQHADGLSVSIHASISGKVTEVTDRHIIIAAK